MAQRSLSDALATIVSVTAVFGVVGWFIAPLLISGAQTSWVGLMAFGFVAVFGASLYIVLRWRFRRWLAPIRDVAALLDNAARGVSSKHSSLYGRMQLAASQTAIAEFRSLLTALAAYVRRSDEHRTRQVGWTAAVVHDIKAPLAASANVVGALAASKALGGSVEGEALRRVADELRSLGGQVQRMVDAVRFERDDVEVCREQVDLRALLSEIVDQLAGDSRAPVSVRGEAMAIVDRALMKRALLNLVENASRCARTMVDVELLPGLIRIADDGGGLPDSFEALSRPFRSAPTMFAGVEVQAGAGGIGLFLARRVMELHGGRIVVESSDVTGTVMLAYLGGSRG